jgi:hypothetical protein
MNSLQFPCSGSRENIAKIAEISRYETLHMANEGKYTSYSLQITLKTEKICSRLRPPPLVSGFGHLLEKAQKTPRVRGVFCLWNFWSPFSAFIVA